jgi:hypothetical protein
MLMVKNNLKNVCGVRYFVYLCAIIHKQNSFKMKEQLTNEQKNQLRNLWGYYEATENARERREALADFQDFFESEDTFDVSFLREIIEPTIFTEAQIKFIKFCREEGLPLRGYAGYGSFGEVWPATSSDEISIGFKGCGVDSLGAGYIHYVR